MTCLEVTNWLQAVGAMALVITSILQWRVYRQQAKIMSDQLAAATKTVDSANTAITMAHKRDLTSLTMSFYAMWMAGEMYSVRTAAGKFCGSIKGGQRIIYQDLEHQHPSAWEQVGRITHFISEMIASYESDLMDKPLTKSLFGTTLIEWNLRLEKIHFPDDPWHKEFDRRRKLAVSEFDSGPYSE